MLRRLLIASSNAVGARGLADAFPKQEFLVALEPTGAEALERAYVWRPDCALLDTELPGVNGLELCGRLKGDTRTQHTPVLLIAPTRDQAQVNRGLTRGADDFMVRPCHPTELLWRVRGLIRRYQAPSPSPELLRLGPFELEMEQGLAKVRGRPVSLTKKEICVLELFLRNPARVLSRRFVLESIWGYDRSLTEGPSPLGTRVVDLCVFQLRRKLGPRLGRCLQTRRNFGYYLKLPA